jgi:plasmid maintenance system antidote protein VapI
LRFTHPGRLRASSPPTGCRSTSACRPAALPTFLNGRRSITADTAVRLGRYFGNSAQFWLDLQSQYDIAVVEREKGGEIAKRVRPADAA